MRYKLLLTAAIFIFFNCNHSDVSPADAGSSDNFPYIDNSTELCSLPSTQFSGEGTFYGATGGGNCSFTPSNDRMIAAMNHADYKNSKVCGACIHAIGPSGEVTVQIVDQCPECNPGDIDFSKEAFGMLASPELGRISIKWTYAPCDLSGPVIYHFKEGSNAWWLGVQVRNIRYAIEQFEIQKDGKFIKLERQDYNYFVLTDPSGRSGGPYTFRITSVTGQVLEDSNIPFVENGDSPGAKQFPRCVK